MQYRISPKSGEKLSALGFGCMRFTRRGAAIDQEKAEKEMALAVRRGVNYFDTAYIYPGSEVCLGTFLKKYGFRDRVNIATKLPQYYIRKAGDAERYFRDAGAGAERRNCGSGKYRGDRKYQQYSQHIE